jgi:iron-sulfur cluster repair protein YtfE (RIC family)
MVMARKTSSGSDVIRLLKKDHAEVKALFGEYESRRASKRAKEILDRICDELTIHAQIEEEIFYPAVAALRSKDAKLLVAKSKEEHALMRMLINELRPAQIGDIEVEAKIQVLKDSVLHHVREEERIVFVEVERKMSQSARNELGERVEERKKVLLGEELSKPEMGEEALPTLH